MSDLLNSASLVLIPSGYKEDTVYSVVPSDGSGDLSFTRASNGTRVNSAGLVEVCPWNLNDNSETFSGAGWGTDGTSTATDNFTTAPNGTMTAAKVVANANGYAYKGLPVNTGFYTFSLYVKASANTTIALSFDAGSVVKNVTTEWQRFEFAYNVTTAGTQYIVYGGLATGVNYFIWGAQLNIGATAKPYFPTTDRLNVPRLTYQNGGGGCPSLLLEKQSTNLFTYSEQLQTGTGGTITVTPNTAISPDGTQNADSLDTGYLTKSISATAGTWTFSTFAKYLSSNTFGLYIYDGAYYTATFNVSTGVVTGTTAGVTASMQNMGNGWYRCIMTTTTANNVSEVGFGSGNVYAWGCQMESGSYGTSYINTTSASATRVADACFKTGISSLIGQTEGTFFAELTFQSGAIPIFIGSSVSGSAGEATYVEFDGSTIVAWIYKGGVLQAQMSASGLTNGQNFKLAVGYKLNDFALYINGTQRATDTSGDVSTSLTNLTLHTYPLLSSLFQYNGKFSQFALFKTRLTNAELASLTTI
jgi:hypothetical protein